MSTDLLTLLHLAGYSLGVALYGMLLAMSVDGGLTRDATDSSRRMFAMPLGTGLLGVVWNGIALVTFGVQGLGGGPANAWWLATGFAALGFLPAFVVHSALPSRASREPMRVLIAIAYVVSGAGALLQVFAAQASTVPSRAGLLVLTAGYAALLVAILVATRREGRSPRVLLVLALAAIAVSAWHVSSPERANAWWPLELVGHHASLPVVLIILYQDYRFALADLFLRRALSLVAIVAVALALHVLFGGGGATVDRTGAEPLVTTLRHVALLVSTALLYPWIRTATGYFVDRVVLRRADYRVARERLAVAVDNALTEESVLDAGSDALRSALGAQSVTWSATTPAALTGETPLVARRVRAIERADVETADGDNYHFVISRLAGGRRLLSEDVAFLDIVASMSGRRIDVLRITQERFARDAREMEIMQLATEAELRALRAQLNPHFLFNALNTIGYLLQRSPDRAMATLYRLTSLLRAVLKGTSGPFATLDDELSLIEAYLAIEQERFEERLRVNIVVPDALRQVRIPPLLLQPLVENAIKHGIAPSPEGGTVRIDIAGLADDARGSLGRVLRIVVHNTGSALSREWRSSAPANAVGITNIEQRLRKHYGGAASLRLSTHADGGTTAEIQLPMPVGIASAVIAPAVSQAVA